MAGTDSKNYATTEKELKQRAQSLDSMTEVILQSMERITSAVSSVQETVRKTGDEAEQSASETGVIMGAVKSVVEGLDKTATKFTDYQGALESMSSQLFSDLGSQLVASVQGQKNDFESVFKQLGNTMMDIAWKMVAGKAMGLGSGWLSMLFHQGGIVGAGGAPLYADASLFASAPRYHSGGIIGPNEVPIIAEKGEMILTKAQQRGLFNPGNVQINVINNSAALVDVQTQDDGNGGITIHTLIDDAMASAASRRGSKFSTTMRSGKGLLRR